MKRLVIALSLSAVVVAVGVPWRPGAPIALGAPGPHGHRAACSRPGPHTLRCNAELATDASGDALVGPNVMYGSLTPVQLHTAYNLPCTPGGPVQAVCSAPSSYSGQPIVAIVDAYNDPTLEYDLGIYDTQFGLPDCTQANGCLTVLDENGGANLPTTVDGGWALEVSLDVQTVHDICQTCRIVLLEAASNGWTDMARAVNTAATLGPVAISNSYGGSEWAGETSLDSYFNHPGVAVVASSGDSGYGTQYPATSPYVVSVGGTTLNLNSDGTYRSESAWFAGGSGCSQYEPANSWETAVSGWSQTGCGTMRGVSDLSADADPNTGAAIWDSTPDNGEMGWWMLGGTSLSAPIVAASFALAGGVPSGVNAQQIPYSQFNSSDSRDVTAGSNGTCSTVMCVAAPGYDGPTGLGSPNGIAGFVGSAATPPVASPTATATATATPSPTSPAPIATPTSTSSPADFQMTPSPSLQTIQPGRNVNFMTTLTALGSYKSSVKLSVSGLPAGANASFSSSSVVPSSTGTNVTLQVKTGNSTPGGSYPLTITGTGSDSSRTTHSTQVTLVVPGFSLSLAQSTMTIQRGTIATDVVSVQAVGGFSAPVGLSVSGLPGGVNGSFSPNPVSSTTGSSTLTFFVPAGAGIGTKVVTITGSAYGAAQQKVFFTLTTTP